MNNKQIHDLIRLIVQNELKSRNLLTGIFHLGKVDQIITNKQIKCFIDGSDTSQTVSCNPGVTFAIGDEVWVVYINGNPRDKFAICKRAI